MGSGSTEILKQNSVIGGWPVYEAQKAVRESPAVSALQVKGKEAKKQQGLSHQAVFKQSKGKYIAQLDKECPNTRQRIERHVKTNALYTGQGYTYWLMTNQSRELERPTNSNAGTRFS